MSERSGTVADGEDELIIEISNLAHEFARMEVDERPDAEDLAQDIVLACLEKIRGGTWDTEREGVPALVKWLVQHRAITQRLSRRRHERRDGHHLRELTESQHAWMLPEVAIHGHEMATLYQKALWSLTPACREVYLMVREGGMSYKRVAAQLGIKRSTVNSHVATAQQRITAILKDAGVSTVGRRSVGRRAKGKEAPKLTSESERELA